jgi:gamma-glutamyltranspeptidase/glutathione hydrolase
MNTQALETLALLRGADLAAAGFLEAGHLHTVVESIKIAQSDQEAHGGDRLFDPMKVLEESYAARRRAEIDPKRAGRSVSEPLGPPWWDSPPTEDFAMTASVGAAHSETTHLVTADAEGNLVSLTQSLGRHFGSRAIAGDTGIVLNNLYPLMSRPTFGGAAPTVLMSPQGAPFMTLGSPGRSSESVPQTIVHLLDYQLNPQAAVEAPRVYVFKDFQVMMETRIPEETRAELARRGHDCVLVGEWGYGEGQLGRVQVIVRERSGLLCTGSDPRGDGVAQAI